MFLEDIENKNQKYQEENYLKQKYFERLRSKVADAKLDKKAGDIYIKNLKKRYIDKLKDNVVESKELNNKEGQFITKMKKKYFDALKNITNDSKEKKRKQQQLRDEQAVITANKVVDGAIKRFRQSGLTKQFLSPSTPNELKSKTPEQPPLINPYRRNQLSNTPVYIPTPPKQKKTEIPENESLRSKTVQTLFQPVIKGKYTKQEGSKKEVYYGVAEYHLTAKGEKKYKQDITMNNKTAVLKN